MEQSVLFNHSYICRKYFSVELFLPENAFVWLFQTEEDEYMPRLITLQFLWKESQAKPIGSSFIGTSPEFEMALYTLVFLSEKGEKVQLQIADYEVEVHCFRHGRGIGTAYPQSKEG